MSIAIVGGCIRLYDTGPEWHTNDVHHSIGVDTNVQPTIDNGDVYFPLLGGALPVVAAIAAPDETLATRGILAGISGGVSYCRIRLAVDGRSLELDDEDDLALVAGPYSNLWWMVSRVVPDPA